MPVVQENSPETVDHLVNENIKLAHFFAQQWSFGGRIDYDEALSRAMEGLLRAAQFYKPEKGRMITNPHIIVELKRLAEQSGGLLKPETVVESARDPASPLHEQFEWDDSEAAQLYRVQQARQLLRVTVQWIRTDTGRRPVQVFVSLAQDRREGGYRQVVEVLTDEALREQMLADALAELDRLRQKYSDLQELAGVFSALAKVAA